jgi:hypothetical protein
MMRQLGACDDTTLVVTTVHESQLLDDLPSSVMTEHDLYVYSFLSLFFLLIIDWILDQLMLLLHHNE